MELSLLSFSCRRPVSTGWGRPTRWVRPQAYGQSKVGGLTPPKGGLDGPPLTPPKGGLDGPRRVGYLKNSPPPPLFRVLIMDETALYQDSYLIVRRRGGYLWPAGALTPPKGGLDGPRRTMAGARLPLSRFLDRVKVTGLFNSTPTLDSGS